MRSYELHTIRSGLDARLAEIAGLPNLDITNLDCTSCAAHVGLDGGFRFEPFALVLGDTDMYLIFCADCVDPIVDLDKRE